MVLEADEAVFLTTPTPEGSSVNKSRLWMEISLAEQ
jgi:hypothetical protein